MSRFDVSVVIATYGDLAWEELAFRRAYPSARREIEAAQGTSVCSVHLEDGTLAEARNLGAADAGGSWLCFLDADDELAPGYLAAMATALHAYTHQPGEVATNSGPRPTRLGDLVPRPLLVPAVCFVEREGEYGIAEIPNGGGDRPLVDINHAVIGTLVPRRLFLEVGGFRELPALEDWDLWLRCEEEGATLVPVPDAVYRAWSRRDGRNQDQSLYSTLRTEALTRRRIRGKGRNAPGSPGDGDRVPLD